MACKSRTPSSLTYNISMRYSAWYVYTLINSTNIILGVRRIESIYNFLVCCITWLLAVNNPFSILVPNIQL